MKKRSPDAVLISSEATYSDGYPVLFTKRRGTLKLLDKAIQSEIWSVSASFKGQEVNLECGTSGLQQAPPEAQRFVEAEIFKVLKTLRFER